MRGEKSQREMAIMLGVEQASYAYYELGKRQPKLDDFTRMCRVLNVSADWMLGLDAISKPIPLRVAELMSDADRLVADAVDVRHRVKELAQSIKSSSES